MICFCKAKPETTASTTATCTFCSPMILRMICLVPNLILQLKNVRSIRMRAIKELKLAAVARSLSFTRHEVLTNKERTSSAFSWFESYQAASASL